MGRSRSLKSDHLRFRSLKNKKVIEIEKLVDFWEFLDHFDCNRIVDHLWSVFRSQTITKWRPPGNKMAASSHRLIFSVDLWWLCRSSRFHNIQTEVENADSIAYEYGVREREIVARKDQRSQNMPCNERLEAILPPSWKPSWKWIEMNRKTDSITSDRNRKVGGFLRIPRSLRLQSNCRSLWSICDRESDFSWSTHLWTLAT